MKGRERGEREGRRYNDSRGLTAITAPIRTQHTHTHTNLQLHMSQDVEDMERDKHVWE